MIPLANAWSERRFMVCFAAPETLQPAVERMVEHLVARAAAVEAKR